MDAVVGDAADIDCFLSGKSGNSLLQVSLDCIEVGNQVFCPLFFSKNLSQHEEGSLNLFCIGYVVSGVEHHHRDAGLFLNLVCNLSVRAGSPSHKENLCAGHEKFFIVNHTFCRTDLRDFENLRVGKCIRSDVYGFDVEFTVLIVNRTNIV